MVTGATAASPSFTFWVLTTVLPFINLTVYDLTTGAVICTDFTADASDNTLFTLYATTL